MRTGAAQSSPGLAERVAAIFAAFIQDDAPGAVVQVTRRGRTLLQAAYGLADLPRRAPLTPQSIFHLGSVGKQFTALAVLMLAEQGKLRLDDSIGDHLPELARFGAELTVRRMLGHTSGLPDYYDDPDLGERLLQLSPQPDNAAALALLAAQGELQFTPGERFCYSNTSYEMLGSLVERLSGQPLAAFLQKRIFDPLGMTHTFSLPSLRRENEARLAHSYICVEGQVSAYDCDPLDHLVGSGSVYSTAGDLARYDRALYTASLVKQSTLAQAFQPGRCNDGEATSYGLGWQLGEQDGRPYAGHSGSWLGFKAFYARFPQPRLAVIVLLNRDYDLPEGDLALMVAEEVDSELK
jgi:CubicO group peptidase (beta-lactamase class C family)